MIRRSNLRDLVWTYSSRTNMREVGDSYVSNSTTSWWFCTCNKTSASWATCSFFCIFLLTNLIATFVRGKKRNKTFEKTKKLNSFLMHVEKYPRHSNLFLCRLVETLPHHWKSPPCWREKGKARPNVIWTELGNFWQPTFQSHRSLRTSTQSSPSNEFLFHQTRHLDTRRNTRSSFISTTWWPEGGLVWASLWLTSAGQSHHIGWLRRRANTPVVGCSYPELVVSSRDESVDLNALLPAAGHLLPQQWVWQGKRGKSLICWYVSDENPPSSASIHTHTPSCLYSTE